MAAVLAVAILAFLFLRKVNANPDAGYTIPTSDLDKDGAAAKRANLMKNRAAVRGGATAPDGGK